MKEKSSLTYINLVMSLATAMGALDYWGIWKNELFSIMALVILVVFPGYFIIRGLVRLGNK